MQKKQDPTVILPPETHIANLARSIVFGEVFSPSRRNFSTFGKHNGEDTAKANVALAKEAFNPFLRANEGLEIGKSIDAGQIGTVAVVKVTDDYLAQDVVNLTNTHDMVAKITSDEDEADFSRFMLAAAIQNHHGLVRPMPATFPRIGGLYKLPYSKRNDSYGPREAWTYCIIREDIIDYGTRELLRIHYANCVAKKALYSVDSAPKTEAALKLTKDAIEQFQYDPLWGRYADDGLNVMSMLESTVIAASSFGADRGADYVNDLRADDVRRNQFDKLKKRYGILRDFITVYSLEVANRKSNDPPTLEFRQARTGQYSTSSKEVKELIDTATKAAELYGALTSPRKPPESKWLPNVLDDCILSMAYISARLLLDGMDHISWCAYHRFTITDLHSNNVGLVVTETDKTSSVGRIRFLLRDIGFVQNPIKTLSWSTASVNWNQLAGFGSYTGRAARRTTYLAGVR